MPVYYALEFEQASPSPRWGSEAPFTRWTLCRFHNLDTVACIGTGVHRMIRIAYPSWWTVLETPVHSVYNDTDGYVATLKITPYATGEDGSVIDPQ
jgi:hypothetical protein